MTEKSKAKDKAAKEKLAREFPELVRETVRTAGADEQQVAQVGSAVDAILAPYAQED